MHLNCKRRNVNYWNYTWNLRACCNGVQLCKTWMILRLMLSDVLLLWVNFFFRSQTHLRSRHNLWRIHWLFISNLSETLFFFLAVWFFFFSFFLFKLAGGDLKMFKGSKQIAWLHSNQIVCKYRNFFSSYSFYVRYLHSIYIIDFIWS